MKKLLVGLFVFAFLATGIKANASTLSDALLQIQNLKKEIASLNLKLKSSALDSIYGSQTSDSTYKTQVYDSTPRISYYPGKVNQHIDIASGTWQTDSDGTSGSGIDKLTYCKKFYPNTTSVVDYKTETIDSWYDAGNVNNYTSTRMSYKCAEGGIVSGSVSVPINGGWSAWSNTGSCSYGFQKQSRTCTNPSPSNGGASCVGSTSQSMECFSTTPSITVLTPNGGESYTVGHQITVKWNSNNISNTENVLIEMTRADQINNPIGTVLQGWIILAESTPNDGVQTFLLDKNITPGKYELAIRRNLGDAEGDISDNLFTINSLSTDIGCSNGVVYSLTTGAKCPAVSSCTDSDGGKNINVKGFTDGRVNGLGSSFYDSSVGLNGGACIGNSCTGVAEGYCENGNVTNLVIQCPSGYSVNGVCTDKTITTPTVTVLSPNGGESYYLGNGNSITKKIKIVSSKIGSLNIFLVENPSISNPGSKIFLTSSGGLNAAFNKPEDYIDSSTTGLESGLIKSGKYYLMSEWKSNDGIENLVDFSDNYFTINSSSDDKTLPDLNIPTSYNYLPSIAQIGKEIILSSGVKNSGTIPATAEFYNHFELTTCASTVNCDIISLPSESSVKPTTYLKEYVGDMSAKYIFNKTGTFNIRACVDQVSLTNNKGNITESDELNNCGSWQTIKVFDNSSPYIAIAYPQGGETFKAGNNITIKWASNNIIADVVGILLFDSNNQIKLNIYSTPNDGVEKITLPQVSGENFKFMISNDQTGGVYSNPFTISSSSLDTGCSNGAIFSSTTGERCYSSNSSDSSTKINRVLKWGTRGEDVKRLQEFLGVGADGVFGRGTASKVKEWQVNNGLTGDGLFGYQSRVKANLNN